jgi:hypothetical protein
VIPPEEILGTVPEGLRSPLIETFNTLLRNFRERRWEPAELNGGKFSEIVYSILRGRVDGSFPARPVKPPNMVDACKELEKVDPAKHSRSLRVQIPRVLVALYEIRNNRGVGHAGGDVDPNHMDAVVVIEMSKWVLAELVRLFHAVDTRNATHLVERLITRTVPIVWETGEARRVLNPNLSIKDQTLVLLHSAGLRVADREVARWVEYSNPSMFKKRVLAPLHHDRLIEYDAEQGTVEISPVGIRHVETKVPLEL